MPSLARRLFALLSVLAVLLLSIPCASASAEPVRAIPAPASTAMPCCEHSTNLNAPSLCCAVHAQPADAVIVPLDLPHLTTTTIHQVITTQHVHAGIFDRGAACSPPPLLRPILRL